MSHPANENGIEDPTQPEPVDGRTPTSDAAVTPVLVPAPRTCENCGATLLGEHCYACGQPVKGLVRHFSSIFGDFFDTVLNIDSRVFRSLWPLFGRPGFLTCEYFAGRRVRYVSPVRLFFFLSIVTFFVAQFTVSFGDDINMGTGAGNDDIASARTVADVEKVRDAALAKLELARRQAGDAPGAGVGISMGMGAVRDAAASRIAELRDAAAKGEPVPEHESEHDSLSFGNGPWDAKKNPIKITALPGFANDWLNAQAGRADNNIARIKQDPDVFKDALLSAVPSTLFVLLPVFALMLKLLYAFKRRLYMEHLIVALHSHAFLCLSLLLMFLLLAAEQRIASAHGFLRGLIDWLEAGLWIWMPLYLLLMQKRVYGQRWPMTLLKYFVLGISYVILLSFGAVFTVLGSLVWM